MFISTYGVFSFIHCNTRFSIGKGGGAAVRGLEILHGQQQSHEVLLAPHQDGPSKVGDAVAPLVLGRLLGLFPFSVASRTCLADRS